MADPQLYVVNLDFDGGQYGEIITADPSLVQDWIDAGFIGRVDERGERIIELRGPRGGLRGEIVDEGAAPIGDPGSVREVTEDDLAG